MLEPTQTSVRCVTDAKSVRQMSPEKDVSANGVREIKFPYRHMMTSWRIALWNSHGHFIFRLRMTSIEIIPKLQKVSQSPAALFAQKTSTFPRRNASYI